MSKPKTQESLKKPQSAGPPGFLQNRCSLTLKQNHEKAVAEISMRDFLDFLKISYQVNEAIDNPSLDVTEKGSVDWKKLTSDVLVNRLKEREALLNKEKIENIECCNKLDLTTCSEKISQNKIVADSLILENTLRHSSEEKVLEKKFSAEKRVENLSNESITSTQSLDRKITLEKLGLAQKKNHGFKKENSSESEALHTFSGTDERAPAKQLKKKLNEVLQEGILDSVLPYLLPKHQNSMQENAQVPAKKLFACDIKKPHGGNLEKNGKSSAGSIAKEKIESKKKISSNSCVSDKNDKRDIEVIIHVCDEIKNLKKDFKCSEKLLLSQMGYFAEVTAGQKLEDMDISVHCDVIIFDWLMKWVQKESLSEEHWPVLGKVNIMLELADDPTIAIPVLMSSTFLQMNSLYEYCLIYCKNHFNDVIKDSPNLSCLNDNVLTRLANLLSNTEVENIIDKKDKIQSRLFCKLIVALTEPEPQPSRGHYSSLATIYRCSKCLKLILKNMSNLILCVASNMKMDCYGTIHSTHVYDSSWNLTDYVKSLKLTLKSWRKVYWRLWADCHFLYCQICEEYFSVGRMNWCRFHVEHVQYFPLENQRSVFHSIGRYPCCGERVSRFQVVKKLSGCQYRDHVVNPKNTNENEILKLFTLHKDLIKTDPPSLHEAENGKCVKGVAEDGVSKKNALKDSLWWDGLEIVPTKQPSGFLNNVWDAVIKKDDSKTVGSNPDNKVQKSPVTKMVATQQSSIQDISSLSDSSDDCSSSSNAVNSEESYHATKVVTKSKNSAIYNFYCASNRLSYVRKEKKRKKKKKKKNSGAKNEGNRFWLSKLSTRCNQDNQREFEERALRQVESILAKKLSGESFLEKRNTGSRNNYQVMPSGGIYVRLEQEWREAHCFSHGCPGSSIKARGSASHVNVNNSCFLIQKRSKSRSHR